MIEMYPCRVDALGNISKEYRDFSSFVFNERFQKIGDAQITSYDPEGLFKTFPLNSMMCSSNSMATMQCVKHDYARDATGAVKGVVSCVTPESILQFRSIIKRMAVNATLEAEAKDLMWTDKVDVLNVFRQVFSWVNNEYHGRSQFKKLQIPFFFEEFLAPKYDGSPAITWTYNRVFQPKTFDEYTLSTNDTLYKLWEEAMKFSQVDGKVQRIPGKTALNFVIRRPIYKADHIRFLPNHLISETSSKTCDTPNVFVSPMDNLVSVHDVPDENVYDPELMGMNYRMSVRPINGDGYDGSGGVYNEDLNRVYDERLKIIKDRADSFVTGVELNKSFVDNRYNMVAVRTNSTTRYEYDLGDVVSVDSLMHGLVEMIVSEYIRVQDESGYKEYPVFIPFSSTDHQPSLGAIRSEYFKKVARSWTTYTWS